MAFSDDSLSIEPMLAPYAGGRALTLAKTVDYETGGIAVSDPLEGHLVQVWKTQIINNNTDIELSAELVTPTIIYSGADISEVSLTFDQNMRTTFSFVEGGVSKLRWYDSSVQGFVTTEFDAGVITPRVSLDDKRATQMGTNDIILAYIREGNLYFRMQRDRFGVEYLLKEPANSSGIIKIGMNTVNRFQFQLRF